MNMMLRLCAAMLLNSALVHGHGHVKSPESRAEACRSNGGANKNCGQVQYEAWSVEGPDRYPDSNPPDGKLGSGGAVRFPELDEQSATRWAKQPMSSGSQQFTWKFQANHATLDFRYFITKNGWNPDAPLSRSAFESEPFCTIERGGALPPMTDVHTCTVPGGRTGYHIIYAVWDVYDTSNSFYNVIDCDFGGAPSGGGGNPMPPPPSAPRPVPQPPAPRPVPQPPAPRPVPQPQPQPAPRPQSSAPSGCASTIGRWGGCKHAPNCCAPGNICNASSQWYSQCIPSNQASPSPPPQRPSPPPPQRPSPPAPQPQWQPPQQSPPKPSGGGGRISRWGGCIHNPSGCEAGCSCYAQNKWYAQCLKDGDNNRGTRIG